MTIKYFTAETVDDLLTVQERINQNFEELLKIDARISQNCGFPNGRGTLRWQEPQKAYNKELCFLREPDGWFDSVDSFTKEQMLAGVDVSRVKLEDFDPAWLAPAEEEE